MSVLNSFSNWVFERKSSHEMRCGSSVFDVWNISNHELKGVCSAWGSSFCALLNNHYVDILSHSWLYWFRTEARIYLSNGQWPLHVKIFVQKYLNYCPAKILAANCLIQVTDPQKLWSKFLEWLGNPQIPKTSSVFWWCMRPPRFTSVRGRIVFITASLFADKRV